jgi:hypothetical protein
MLKIPRKPLILFSAFLLFGVIALGQHKRKHHHVQNTAPKLYLCMGNLGPTADAFMLANNIQYVKLVGSVSIDPNNDMTLHEDLLSAQIARLYPNANDTGTALLDWEGKAMNSLNALSPDDPNYAVIMQKYIRAVQVSKQLRPNVKWSIYGMPFRGYWTMDNAWEKRCLGLAPLLQQCDFIAPSLYNPYPDSVSKGNERSYVRGNIQIALRLGSMVNRPVYPLIWHRLPDSRLISKDEFLRHVQSILNESYNGNKVKGLIWYGEDTYSYNVKNKKMMSEVGEDKNNLTPYLHHLLTDYGSSILQLLKQQN